MKQSKRPCREKLSEETVESLLEVVQRFLQHQRIDDEIKNGDITMSKEILVKI